MRFPVAAKMAFVIAGAIGGTGGSPFPMGRPRSLGTMCVSMTGASTRGVLLPMRRKSPGFFSAGVCGTGNFAAASTSRPNFVVRPLSAWRTAPASVVQVAESICYSLAAAWINISRAAAAASHSGFQLPCTLPLPPVPRRLK